MRKCISIAAVGALSLLFAGGAALAKVPYKGGQGPKGADCSATESCEDPGVPGKVKHPNAGLGNGGETGDPGRSGAHNAVCGLALGAAAGECDDPAELP